MKTEENVQKEKEEEFFEEGEESEEGELYKIIEEFFEIQKTMYPKNKKR